MAKVELFSPSALMPIMHCLAKRNINSECYLQRHRIPQEAIHIDKGKILKKQFYNFVADVAEHEGLETLGFLDGDEHLFLNSKRVNDALSNALTLKDAITIFSGIVSSMAEGNTIYLHQGHSETWLYCITPSLGPHDTVPDHLTIMVLRELVRLFTSPLWQPGRIKLFTTPTSGIHRLPGLANIEIQFLQGITGIAFPTPILSNGVCTSRTPVGTQNKHIYRHLDQKSISGKLYSVVSTWGQGGIFLTIDEVAEIIGLSRVTLFRSLRSEGTSYREIVKRVRFDLATSLLNESSLSIKEIAYKLHYSSISNFSRAFCQIAGVSPSSFRDKNKNIF